ncbi:Zinc finger, C2H2 [Penicillium occitanis (nom. inval.)]|nr:hypothetical protein PENOC_065130 [Penicillium occitanis (nom. inval.)]PCH05759.1 Zinc finger, C2H2 [Penicillium occitanis (nom. inval.)]
MAETPVPRVAISTRKATATKKKQTPDADNQTYACQICGRTFGSSKALRSHCFATKHHVRCPVCDKGFMNNEALQQHAHIHAIDAILDISGVSKDEQMVTLQEVNEQAVELENPTMSASLRESVIVQGIEHVSLNDNSQQMVVAQQGIVQKDGIFHKSNVYTLLPDTEQETIYQALLAACHTVEVLDAEQYTVQFLTERKLHTNVPYSEFRQTPPAPNQSKRKVVAIDCEMVGLWKNTDCVALLCAVDVLTGEILLNTYVNPVSKVLAWRSTVSGVTRQSMSEAIEQGRALRGWAAARDALWEYIDAETIIVGHALQNDLNVLGIFHPRIVDTAILASQVVFPETRDKKFPESYGLKRLLLSWLNMTIQTGKKGHDCLEDTLATRELAIWCVKNPHVLKSWGSQMRVAYEARKVAIQQAKEEAKKRAKEASKQDAKDGAEKFVLTDVKKDVRMDFRKDARKNTQKDVKNDAKVDAKNGGTRKYIRKGIKQYPRGLAGSRAAETRLEINGRPKRTFELLPNKVPKKNSRLVLANDFDVE